MSGGGSQVTDIFKLFQKILAVNDESHTGSGGKEPQNQIAGGSPVGIILPEPRREAEREERGYGDKDEMERFKGHECEGNRPWPRS